MYSVLPSPMGSTVIYGAYWACACSLNWFVRPLSSRPRPISLCSVQASVVPGKLGQLWEDTGKEKVKESHFVGSCQGQSSCQGLIRRKVHSRLRLSWYDPNADIKETITLFGVLVSSMGVSVGPRVIQWQHNNSISMGPLHRQLQSQGASLQGLPDHSSLSYALFPTGGQGSEPRALNSLALGWDTVCSCLNEFRTGWPCRETATPTNKVHRITWLGLCDIWLFLPPRQPHKLPAPE